MPVAEFYTAAVETSQWITAGGYLLGALVIAEIVDRALSRRGKKLTSVVGVGELSPVATTRLRLVRRLTFAVIILIGVALAAAQIPSISKLATGILASSAVLGLVVGFAARQTLANGIAGILLAITQPIRLGDRVTFEDETGEVEDVKLTYTYIRLDDGRRLIVPNERLAQSSIANHTIVDPRVQVEASVWLPPAADLDRAIELIEDGGAGISASVAEVDKEGVRLSATAWAESPSDRGAAAADLRRRWLRLLREHGLSSVEAS
jgi:small-conductance mechanosensitive channel